MALILFAGVVIMNLPDDVLPLPWRVLGSAVCFGVFLLTALLDYRRRKKANDKLPITAVSATVVGRRIELVGPSSIRRRAYFLSFRTEAGETLEFEVSEIDYGRFDDGDSGTLEYRGWQYLGMRRYDLSGT